MPIAWQGAGACSERLIIQRKSQQPTLLNRGGRCLSMTGNARRGKSWAEGKAMDEVKNTGTKTKTTTKKQNEASARANDSLYRTRERWVDCSQMDRYGADTAKQPSLRSCGAKRYSCASCYFEQVGGPGRRRGPETTPVAVGCQPSGWRPALGCRSWDCEPLDCGQHGCQSAMRRPPSVRGLSVIAPPTGVERHFHHPAGQQRILSRFLRPGRGSSTGQGTQTLRALVPPPLRIGVE